MRILANEILSCEFMCFLFAPDQPGLTQPNTQLTLIAYSFRSYFYLAPFKNYLNHDENIYMHLRFLFQCS
jgi:hypothetical protein